MSHEPMVVETWLTPQNDRKSIFSGPMQANYTHAITGSAPKLNSDIWGPFMVKFWHFLYWKNYLTDEIGYLVKITALFNFLIVPYSLESNISDKKWNYCCNYWTGEDSLIF